MDPFVLSSEFRSPVDDFHEAQHKAGQNSVDKMHPDDRARDLKVKEIVLGSHKARKDMNNHCASPIYLRRYYLEVIYLLFNQIINLQLLHALVILLRIIMRDRLRMVVYLLAIFQNISANILSNLERPIVAIY